MEWLTFSSQQFLMVFHAKKKLKVYFFKVRLNCYCISGSLSLTLLLLSSDSPAFAQSDLAVDEVDVEWSKLLTLHRLICGLSPALLASHHYKWLAPKKRPNC